MKKITMLFAFIAFVAALQTKAHCEIPCGIYGDSMRVDLIKEHIKTIEKSMNQIVALSEEDDEDYNQIVRWVVNKEEHAIKIQDIVSQYFLHQRIKPVDDGNEGHEKYVNQLKTLHLISIHAMKAKQTTDLKHIAKLRDLVKTFEKLYFHHHHH